MKRPHRSIETFDISLMAVVTKAMGAFLVLMLLLMPYYRSGPIGQKEASDLAKKADEVKNSLSVILEKLTNASVEDLRALLEQTRAQLDEARMLIVKLQRFIDQLNAQVARLEQENEAFKTEIADLKQTNEALTARVADLEQQIAPLRTRITELENQIEPLKARIAELENQIEPLKARISELENIVDPLRRENDGLKAKIAELENIVEPLRRENDGLKAKNAELNQQLNIQAERISELTKEKDQLNARVIELLAEKLKEGIGTLEERKKEMVVPPPLAPEVRQSPEAPDQKKEQMKKNLPDGSVDFDKLRRQHESGGGQGSPSPQPQPGGQN